MLYVKLTLRNLQRSMKEYAIFMLTMVISMMLMYSFMAVAFSEQVLQLICSGYFGCIYGTCYCDWLVDFLYSKFYVTKAQSRIWHVFIDGDDA